MTHDTEALKSLLAKVEAATGPDPILDRLICCEFGIGPWLPRDRNNIQFCMTGSKSDKATPKLTASIDAALALVEQVLPDTKGYEIIALDYQPAVQVCIGDAMTTAPTAPLAILRSLLTAALAQGGPHEA